VLTTGLLMAPQGLGAALGVAVTGRMTDRIGGGPIVLGGLVILLVGTLPFTQLTNDTSYWLLAGAMFVRGIGFGATLMPSMAAVFATLDRRDVSHATPQVNMLRQLGGSVGTALLATILQAEITSRIAGLNSHNFGMESVAALPTAATVLLADSFGATFWWVMGGTAITVFPALLLTRAERRARAHKALASPVAPQPGDDALVTEDV
jgi:MFS family permease